MADESAGLRAQLRDSQTEVKVAQGALAAAKRGSRNFAIWSAVGGFMLFAIGGHWFPGYQLDSTARASSEWVAEEAVTEVMAALCAERFMSPAGRQERVAELNKTSGDYNKTSYVQRGSWAEGLDGKKADYTMAGKCFGLIAERLSGEAAGKEGTSG